MTTSEPRAHEQPKIQYSTPTMDENQHDHVELTGTSMVQTNEENHEPPEMPSYIVSSSKAEFQKNGSLELVSFDSCSSTHNHHVTGSQTDQDIGKIDDRMSNNNIDAIHHSLCCDHLFWIRIGMLVLVIFLLFLSAAFSVGQMIKLKLDIINECTEKRTLEDIWAHSYETFERKGFMDEESQFGWTKDPCWTLRAIEINTNDLWDHNLYAYSWKSNISPKSALFGLISGGLLMVVIFSVYQLINDLVHIARDTLHQRSSSYKKYIRNQQKKTINNKVNESTTPSKKNQIMEFYFKYFAADTTGWIVVKILSETSEFMVQFQAMLLYNGYSLFDSDAVHLAQKPYTIVVFTVFLSLNMFGTGSLWLLYASCPERCFGLRFNRAIWFVDKYCDLMYILYPFYVVLSDDYNKNTDIFVLLGQLRMDSWWVYIAAYLPLFMLCCKCLMTTITSANKMRDAYFNRWRLRQLLLDRTKSVNSIIGEAREAGFEFRSSGLHRNNGKILDEKNQLVVTIESVRKEHDRNWILKVTGRGRRCVRMLALILSALLLISCGLCAFIFTWNHVVEAETYCGSISESNYFSNGSLTINDLTDSEKEALSITPELFVWDQCLYKVYPFTNAEEWRCQCRVFVIDWDDDLESNATARAKYFNLTQPTIMEGVMSHWTMLEKLKTTGASDIFAENVFNVETLPFLKAFEWTDAKIISEEYGVSTFPNLEYLRFSDTKTMDQLPMALAQSPELKYLSLEYSKISSLPDDLCELRQLIVLELRYEHFTSVPQCISNLINLEAIWIDISVYLTQIPISIFNLPNLLELSLYNAALSYESLIDYNVPESLHNDTNAVNRWFDDNLIFDANRTEIWFSLNPICDENLSNISESLQLFLDSFCPFEISDKINVNHSDLVEISQLCALHETGNGRQLCFAPQLGNCSLSLLNNDACDAGCDNQFCYSYQEGSTFGIPVSGPDMTQCIWNGTANTTNLNCSATESTDSIYLDPTISDELLAFYPDYEYGACWTEWIGDGQCHDACRTEGCRDDGGDCSDMRCENLCGFTYDLWESGSIQFGFGTIQYLFNYTYFCGNVWDEMHNIVGESSPLGNCTESLRAVDFNDDDHVNYREMLLLGAVIQFPSDPMWLTINCSSCVDVGNYNPAYH